MSGQQATVQIGLSGDSPMDHDNEGSIENLTWCVTKNVEGLCKKAYIQLSQVAIFMHTMERMHANIHIHFIVSCRCLIDAHFPNNYGNCCRLC